MHRQPFQRTLSSALTSASVSRKRTGQRFASTFTSRATRRASGAIVRWGLAGAAVYYYSTAAAFADEPRYAAPGSLEVSRESEPFPTIDTIAEQRKAQARASPAAAASSISINEEPVPVDSPEALEEEASQQGAFNEETGEINWDCPCLGGMADGPCGEQFKSAFSCFVFSKEEPKGVDCIEHFKTMQNCFREHPDVYGAELDSEEDAAPPEPETASASEPGPAHAVQAAREHIDDKVEKTAEIISNDVGIVKDEIEAVQAPLATPSKHDPRSPQSRGEDDASVPKAWHDSRADRDR